MCIYIYIYITYYYGIEYVVLHLCTRRQGAGKGQIAVRLQVGQTGPVQPIETEHA